MTIIPNHLQSYPTFGSLLRYLRKRARLTQRELGIATGYSKAQISRIETNQRPPDLERLMRLFVPVLLIENDIETVARLMELAQQENNRQFASQSKPIDTSSIRSHNDHLSVLPTGIVTFLFTDIQGSTPLWERMPGEMKVSLAQHHTILRNSIEANGGHVFQIIGDSFQASFRLVSSALTAAITAQHSLRAAQWGQTGPLRVRMGLHTGLAEIDLRGNAPYEVSHTLNRAARTVAAANGGQILLTQETADLVSRELPKNVTFRDLGEFHLKGMEKPEHLYQVDAPGLPKFFPPLSASKPHASKLPEQLTRFIGRKNDILKVTNLIQQFRLVTLTGSGGVGKTRLTIEVAKAIQDRYPDGVCWVELAPLADPDLLAQTIASTLGLHEDTGRSINETLLAFLHQKRLVLILDNCEHLITACSRLVEILLQGCPFLTVLATSREVLGVPGEIRYRVPSLSFPNGEALLGLNAFLDYEAVRLFVERGLAANSDFRITEQNLPKIAHIIQRLDGIPLAIELATARLGILSVDQLAVRLDDAFRILVSSHRTSLPRQQTLRATIEWSYQLLSDTERIFFNRLSVFSGGFTLAAAEAICGQDRLQSEEVLGLIESLSNKSIIVTEHTPTTVRYRLLETVRTFSLEKCMEANEFERLRSLHANYYLEFAEEAEPYLFIYDGKRKEWFSLVNAELDNLRSTIDWAYSKLGNPKTGLRIATAIGRRYMQSKGLISECRDWLQTGIEQVDDQVMNSFLLARAYNVLGYLALHASDWEAGKEYYERSIAYCREAGPPALAELSWALWGAAYCIGCGFQDLERVRWLVDEGEKVARQLGPTRLEQNYLINALAYKARIYCYFFPEEDLSSTRQLAEDCLKLVEQIGADWYSGSATWILGLIAARQGAYDQAQAYLENALESFLKAEDQAGVANSFRFLGWLAHHKKDYQQALVYILQYIPIWKRFGNKKRVVRGIVDAGIFLAKLSFTLNELNVNHRLYKVVVLFSAANHLVDGKGVPIYPEEKDNYSEVHEQVKNQLDNQEYRAAWLEGQKMNLDDVVDYLDNIPGITKAGSEFSSPALLPGGRSA